MADRFVLVTGAAGAVGQELCRVLARIGVRPIMLARRSRNIDLIAAETSGLAIYVDLASPQDLDRALDPLTSIGTSIETAFIVASPPPCLQQIGRISTDDFEYFLRVNVLANQVILKRLLSLSFRVKREGNIVGVLSEAAGLPGIPPSPLFGAYAVSKTALSALMNQYQVDYPWLSVKQLWFGLINTPMLDAFGSRVIEKFEEKHARITAYEAAINIVKEVYSDEI